MPSKAKHINAKRKPVQKRDDAHSTRGENEVRELWFNPQATKICDSHMAICACDCDCPIWQNENLQLELQKLVNKYSHKGTAGMKLCPCAREETQIKTKAKAREEANEAAKGLNTKRSRSKQREGKEQRKRHASKENENAKTVHEKSRSRSRNRPSPVNRKFKTREEAKRYRELKAIYTTKPQESASSARQNENETKSSRKNQNERGGHITKSTESVTMAAQRPHTPRKPVGRNKSKTRSPLSTDCGCPCDVEERDQPKEHDRETEVGCCGMCKKSKADKRQREYEAYTPTQCPAKHTRMPNREAEFAHTADEAELLEILKATYTREVKPKPAPPPPPPPDTTRDEETGCCGSSSKRKQQQSEANLYDQYRSYECSCGDNYPQEFEPHQPMEEHTSKNIKQTRNRTPEQKSSETLASAKLHKQPNTKARGGKVAPPVPPKYAPRKIKSVESNAKHKNKLDKSQSDSTVYASKRKPKNVKDTENKNAPEDYDSDKMSCPCRLCRMKQKTEDDKPEAEAKTNKKRKSPPAAASLSPTKNQKHKQQATKPEPKPDRTPKHQRYPTNYKPQKADGRKARRRNRPAFHPKPESQTKPATKKAKTSSKQADKSSLNKDENSETSLCSCLRKKKHVEDSNIREKSRSIRIKNFSVNRIR
uniref:Uncharacterized protein n=1 Tax=Zeugodacus cucurbitae TaxID=28588 RepID=A0A0A1WW14_ZEUCU